MATSFTFLMLPPQSDVTREWARRLREDLPEVRTVVAESEEEVEREIGSAEAALGRIPDHLLARAGRLRWLQAPQAAPPAGYYSDALIQHPVVVTNFRGIFNDHISAHIMAFVLAFARGLHRFIPAQLRRQWAQPPLDEGVVDLPASTVLIVGVGGIGGEAALRCSQFGMTVLATDARVDSPPPGVTELHPPEALDELLPRADFVVLTVPHTPATEGLMNRARFKRMRPAAFFINIGRGRTTRLDDLVEALRAGELAGAGLDVFEQEPLPPEHPLWTLPNVLITPHVAGYGPHLDERRYEIIAGNCRAFAAGRPLRNQVDKRAWF